jgi:cytochrome P450/NADPH-cytochrome P450 reductase
LIGNVLSLATDAPVQALMRLARKYGPIYRLDMPFERLVVVSSRELAQELCDQTRFGKEVHASIAQLRPLGGDGLFTAHTEEPNWGKAHRILMPAFGPAGIRDMFDPMLDIAERMFAHWEGLGPEDAFDVSEQMTRLTLDTIALCAFSYRFHSFQRTGMHPFVGAMTRALAEAGARARRPGFLTRLMRLRARRFAADVAAMNRIADGLIAERKRDPEGPGKNDLLSRMLWASDPETGERLSDENIRYQLVTFLIAGHETTSGLLSFATHLLLAHPAALEKARAEVDAALGAGPPRFGDLPKLRYVDQVLKESLRLWPTAPAFAVRAREATVLGGRYPVGADDVMLILLPSLHRDPSAWGDDVEAFRPERFDPEAGRKIPPGAWKPFGNGQRACIGRPFAMQEAALVVARMLQRFDLVPDDPAYRLRVKETLTLKPEGFRIRVRPRQRRPPDSGKPSRPEAGG